MWLHVPNKFKVGLDKIVQHESFSEVVERGYVVGEDWSVSRIDENLCEYAEFDVDGVICEDSIRSVVRARLGQCFVEDGVSEREERPPSVSVIESDDGVSVCDGSVHSVRECKRETEEKSSELVCVREEDSDEVLLGVDRKIEACVCESVECVGNFKRIQIAGDGQCCYSALSVASGVKLSPKALREHLRSSKYASEYLCRLLSNWNEWGDEQVIFLFAREFKVDVCVHVFGHQYLPDGCVLYRSGFLNVRRVHLEWCNNHFNVLVDMSVPPPMLPGGSDMKKVEVRKTNPVDVLRWAKDLSALKRTMHDGLGVNEKLSVRRRMNLISDSGLPEHLMNRSQAKLLEIFSEFGKPKGLCVDLCAAPGGMTRALMMCPEVTKVVSVTDFGGLPVSKSKYVSRDDCENEWCDVNLLNSGVVSEFVSKFSRNVDYVVADGMFEVTDHEAEGCAVAPLIEMEIEIMSKILTPGGTFVVKLMDVFDIKTLSMIEWLCGNFLKVSVVKPMVSRATSSEKYLVCEWFKGFKYENVRICVNDAVSVFSSFIPLVREQMRAIELFNVCRKNDTVQVSSDSGRYWNLLQNGFVGVYELVELSEDVSDGCIVVGGNVICRVTTNPFLSSYIEPVDSAVPSDSEVGELDVSFGELMNEVNVCFDDITSVCESVDTTTTSCVTDSTKFSEKDGSDSGVTDCTDSDSGVTDCGSVRSVDSETPLLKPKDGVAYEQMSDLTWKVVKKKKSKGLNWVKKLVAPLKKVNEIPEPYVGKECARVYGNSVVRVRESEQRRGVKLGAVGVLYKDVTLPQGDEVDEKIACDDNLRDERRKERQRVKLSNVCVPKPEKEVLSVECTNDVEVLCDPGRFQKSKRGCESKVVRARVREAKSEHCDVIDHNISVNEQDVVVENKSVPFVKSKKAKEFVENVPVSKFNPVTTALLTVTEKNNKWRPRCWVTFNSLLSKPCSDVLSESDVKGLNDVCSEYKFIKFIVNERKENCVVLCGQGNEFLSNFVKFLKLYPYIFFKPIYFSLDFAALKTAGVMCSEVCKVLMQYGKASNFRFELIVSKEEYKTVVKTVDHFFPSKNVENFKDSGVYAMWRERSGSRLAGYSPCVVKGTSVECHFMNAMYEQRELWRVKEQFVLENCQVYYRGTYKGTVNSVQKDMVCMSPEGYSLYNYKTGNFIAKNFNCKKKYEFCYDGGKIVKYEDLLEGRVESTSDVVLFCDDLVLLQEKHLYACVENVDVATASCPYVELMQGVPGCGKTTYILNHVKLPTEDFSGDLVLCATREGAEDVRERMKNLHGEKVAKYLKRNYVTVDSYLLNGSTKHVCVYVDEALMLHAGHVMFAASKAGCERLVLMGDTRQIPYINRMMSCEVKFSSPLLFVSKVTPLSVSYRCTASVAHILSDLYDDGMKCTSNVVGEMSICVFKSLAAIPCVKGVKYLVFKQSEKFELAKLNKGDMYYDVSTVHEYQGKQTDRVVVVRTSSKKEDIYSSMSHCVVAISRHRKSFEYYTPVFDDVLCKWIRSARRMTAADKNEVCVSSISGGFMSLSPEVFVNVIEDDREDEYVDDVILKHDHQMSECVRPVIESVDDFEAPQNFVEPINVDVDVCVLQEFYDTVLPGNSLHDLSFDPMNVACGDLFLECENMSVEVGKFDVKMVKFDKLKPSLRTSMCPARENVQVETLLAMKKRNMHIPRLCGDNNERELCVLLCDGFLAYVDDSKLDLFKMYRNYPIEVNSASINSWLDLQKPVVRQQIISDFAVHEKFLTYYQYMIKPTVKPQLDTGAPFVYSSLQTIAYHPKDVNVIFCPIWREVACRLKSVLSSKFKIYSEMSVSEFEKYFETHYDLGYLDSQKFLEIDISKYDKSQGACALNFECWLLRVFGVSEYYVTLWYNAHVRTTMHDIKNGVKLKVLYQRKSGDASTFFGNTTFLMAVISVLFDVRSIDCGVFAGDDSLLIGGDIDHDRNQLCASLFNLESKFLRDFRFKYFCSKFLLFVSGKCYFVPDPVKLVTKLGRSDLVNYDHVEEYRISLCDLLQNYSDDGMYDALSAAVCERYHLVSKFNFGYVFSVIYSLVVNKSAFHSMYYQEEGDVLCDDPSRPKLD
ncbi:MAG: RNA-dependent RNA polymerase [Sanya virga-like virus 1]|nr:MAG: RNA-dependent RNA polymerase [Sanya virga-like virus 1]